MFVMFYGGVYARYDHSSTLLQSCLNCSSPYTIPNTLECSMWSRVASALALVMVALALPATALAPHPFRR